MAGSSHLVQVNRRVGVVMGCYKRAKVLFLPLLIIPDPYAVVEEKKSKLYLDEGLANGLGVRFSVFRFGLSVLIYKPRLTG
jgi:hypothetical protein